jgi:hypothetical protein
MMATYDALKILKDWIISIGKGNDRFIKYGCIIEGREAVDGTVSDILLDRFLKEKAGI